MNNKKPSAAAKYAACILALAAIAAGVSIYMTQRGNQAVQEAAIQEPMVENMAAGTQAAPSSESSEPPAPSVSVPTTVPAKMPETTQAPSQSAAVSPAPGPLKTALPVPGDTIGAYTMDCLSYNETTRDWRVHNGVDLAAEEGAPVGAAADGTVYTTYEDDTLGYTVVIRHDGGYTTRYSSLGETLCVAPGDVVTMGQTIGYAGDSALVETVMGSHVHFSVSYQDEPMDPAEFFALG